MKANFPFVGGFTLTDKMNIMANTDNDMVKLEEKIFPEGKSVDTKENMSFYIDGELKTKFVEFMKIENVVIEYVENEKEWYVDYKVGHYNRYGNHIKTISLNHEDIEADF